MSEKRQFDVFLCHNTSDKTEVEKIAYKLKELGLVPWLDKWELIPGRSWQRLLEAQIEQVSSAAVFVGKNGMGPWQEQEISAFLHQFNKRACPIIPVLLQNAPKKPNLPLFLQEKGWVDFRQKQPDHPIELLFWGIKGQRLSDYLNSKLSTLLEQKGTLEAEIKDVKQQLDIAESLGNQLDPDLQVLLTWLSDIKDITIAKEYGNKTLKKFPDLKNEVVAKGNLERFHLEISCYLEFICLSIERDDEIFIDEPALPPTLANSEIYKSACFEIYEELFKLVKNRIPERVESAVADKLGANIDSFLKRLLS